MRFSELCSLTLMMMFWLMWIGTDTQGSLTMSAGGPVKNVEFFYGDQPRFSDKHKFFDQRAISGLHVPVDFLSHPYLRCDIDDQNLKIDNLHFRIETGWLGYDWDFSKIPVGKMVLNDVIPRNGNFLICGKDPRFGLTSSCFIDQIQSLALYRKNAFLLVAAVLFLLMTGFHRKAALLKPAPLVLILLFIFLISAGMLMKPFNSEKRVMAWELRARHPRPSFALDSIGAFTDYYSGYLGDELPGRIGLISMNNKLQFYAFGKITGSQDVYFGKDGWMFYTGENSGEMYENRQPLTEDELRSMKEVLVRRRDWLREKGIRFYLCFPRIKQFMYEENLLPDMRRHNKVTKYEQLTDYLKKHTDLEIIDVSTPIFEARKKFAEPLYYRTDSHWNLLGSYFAYAAIINRISKDFPNAGAPIPLWEIEWTRQENTDSDLSRLLALTGTVTRTELIPHHPRIFCASDTLYPFYPEIQSTYPLLVQVNQNDSLPRLVMFRDSFGNGLIPYLSGHFSRCTSVWTPLFFTGVIEKEKPDLVILEMVDRFLYDIIAPNPPIPATSHPSGSHPEKFSNLGGANKN